MKQQEPLVHSIDRAQVLATVLESGIWEAKVGPLNFLCSGALNTRAEVEALMQRAEELKKTPPVRLSACQVCLPSTEWDLIEVEHVWLAWLGWERGLSGQNAHILLPLSHLYHPKEEIRLSEFFLRDIQKVADLQNIDGWETYCFWLAEEAERILEQIPLEALDSYTLEAVLKNFVHEVRTAILRYEELETAENLLRIGVHRKLLSLPIPTPESLVDYEKRVIRARTDARGRLAIQQEILAEAARLIGIIEKAHPELLAFEREALLLSHLLQEGERSWGSRFMLLQLLNQELGVISSVQDDAHADRAGVSFALQIALGVLKQTTPVQELIQLALKWDTLPYRGDPLADKLRSAFLHALEFFSIPLMRKTTEVQKTAWHENYREEGEFLKFMPAKGTLRNKEGALVETELLHFDPKTGAPTSLTTAGHYLLTKLFPKR